MNSMNIMTVLRKQLDCLLQTAKFLDETYTGNMPMFLRHLSVDVAMYSFIPNMIFATVNNKKPYSILFVPVEFPAKGLNSFTAVGDMLAGKEYHATMSVYKQYGYEGIMLLNTSHVIMTYSEVFSVYLNELYDGGPKFGEPNRQIQFGVDGATENAAWYNQFKGNLMVSLSTFAKAVSDIMYDYGVHKVARPRISLIDDLLQIDVTYFDLQGRPVYVQPKIPS